ncbi:MAG: 4-hydroxy-3-methylbut-2-enyl diphosphate reductase, partial [Desulfobacterales bacterium]|nr:4-hydroxy-3-methylbut-2-enyl diphosphate reductase [Desulfobacterales bacterium]
LVVAYTLGWLPFLILLIMSVTGLSYNLRLVPAPAGLFSNKYQRIRDIPSSKTILIAVAWGVVTSLLPSIAESHGSAAATLPVFVWASGMVFVRTAFFDILDMQGDRIVGRETIPILLGETRAMRLLIRILIASMGLLFLTRAFHITPGLSAALAICPMLFLIILGGYKHTFMPPGVKLEFLVESQFILAGAIALLWF